MKLEQLTQQLSIKKWIGKRDLDIHQVTFDSRKVNGSDLFVAVRGTRVDGHQFIDKAIKKGAIVIVAEVLPQSLQQDVTYLQVEDTSGSLGLLASQFYDQPSKKLQLVGVTGTNGKTTTVTLLFELFSKLGYKCGLLSTISNRIGTEYLPATHTTPDAIALNKTLANMVNAGCDYAFMEVSSHAIHQKRIAGVVFAGGIFTNLTHDHLDYHGTFKNYLNAKKAFFDDLPEKAFALTNLDDKNGTVMVQNTKAQVKYYSLRGLTDFKGKLIDNNLNGLQLDFNGTVFYSRLIGDFNAYNLLAVYGVAILLEQDKHEVIVALSSLKTAEGRFDYVQIEGSTITGIVDYAHTPDALLNVLKTINQAKSQSAAVYTVVGCGGDRDREKRPKMARVAAELSHKAILTSDNPRSENPDEIIKDMLTGIDDSLRQKVFTLTDRAEAINLACQLAQFGDIILVAGKGHEKYQEIKGEKNSFDDKEVLGRSTREMDERC